MNARPIHTVPLLLLALACTQPAFAQSGGSTPPSPQLRLLSCGQVEIGWNPALIDQYPDIPSACHEVVTSQGVKFARFEADFVRVNNDGSVTSAFVDPRGRKVGQYTLIPGPTQQVTLSGRRYPFSALRPGQRINLYVPEGAYGLASEPVASPTYIGEIAAYEPVPVEQPVEVARVEPAPTRLPQTAGLTPWITTAGLLSLLFAGGLGAARRFD
jgi:hypothetical protein